MFVDEIRRAAEVAARVELPAVAALMWKAFAAGHVTEAEAETLSALIEARKVIPVTTRSRERVGSRPRTDASMERRRRWAASGRLPPAVAARFTTAEQAVLAVVATEATRHGRCTLANGHLAALAGVSISTVKRAVRAARTLGLLDVQVRRVSAFRNDTNVVVIVSREWTAWLRLSRVGGGGQIESTTNTQILKPATKRNRHPGKEAAGGQGRVERSGRLKSRRAAGAFPAM